MTALAPTLQAFFTDRLMNQRQASRHTIAAYRDTFRLLLGFASEHTGATPSGLDIADLDAPLIGAFLEHLEAERGNSVRTRNARLAAIHSLFAYAALRHPEHAASIQRVLAIPRQALRPRAGHLPDRAGGRRPAGRLRPVHLDRPTRPRDVSTRRPDRAAGLRTDRTDLRRPRPRPRSTRPLPRQGPQATSDPAAAGHGRSDAGLARRARRPPRPTRCSPPAPDGS